MGVFKVFVSKGDCKCSKFDPLIYDKKLVEALEDRSTARIKQLKNIHEGQRCFVIGSGPSLNDVDFSSLESEILFGANRSYKLASVFNCKCKYVAVSDNRFFEDESNHAILDISEETTIFFSLSARRWYSERAPLFVGKNEPILLKRSPGLRITTDLSKGGGIGYTVVLDIVLPAIYYMGFSEVYLLGVDHKYEGDVHYFDGSVNRHAEEGRKNIKISSSSWSDIGKTFEKNGRTIINCTPNSSLTNFKFIPLNEVLKKDKVRLKRIKALNTKERVAAFSEWYYVVRRNISNRRRWYISLPGSWWHGKTMEQFFDDLPNHLDDPEWRVDTLL